MRWWLLAVWAVPTIALAQPIKDGTPASGDPAVIALVHENGRVFCTASVIGSHTAITAAHCVAGLDARTLHVFVGSDYAGDGILIPVSDARIHPGFDPGGRDVALLTLRVEAPVAPLVLEPATLDASLVDTTIRVIGFGITAQGLDDAGIKREGTATITAVRAEELVVVPGPSLSCLGDSGGPALLPAGTIAGVVSRTDAACSDHAVYTRIDVAQSILIEPYLAETAAGTAVTGDACFYEEHCADGPCLQATDDRLLYFCARACERDSDCPATMRCAQDGCRYPLPSPGAFGSSCEQDGECSSGLCREGACTRTCDDTENACPADFECRGTATARYCAAGAAGCGGCASGSGPPLSFVWFVIAGTLLAGRARRRC